MDIILAVDCEDCGTSLITDPRFVTIIQIGEDYLGATICFHCERPLVYDMSIEVVENIIKKGVKILKW